ncbi:MAG: acetyl-CoA C-acyltransferase [Planctomycetota bacterium]|nr:acetyl-CoA C-acyltransferase [Planctomycetota bacterium]
MAAREGVGSSALMTAIHSRDSRRQVVIVGGWRTPLARAGGVFAREDAGHIGAAIARETIARCNIDVEDVDEVIVGCAGPPHDQANVGRVIGLRAGIPERVPGRTVARNCASGMEAITEAATCIEAGRGDMYLVLGVEMMSRFPLIMGDRLTRFFAKLSSARSLGQRVATLASFRPSMMAPRIALMEGLTDPISGMIMGKTAELLAREWNVSREDADRFALESHARAKAAREAGILKREIVPFLPIGAREGQHALAHDDAVRDNQSMESLAKLKPYFEKPDGRVTVGNSCGITDGACAMIVASADRARELGLTPLAKIRSWSYAGLDPARMGLGPVFATAKALDEGGATIADVGSIEINEAFAAQVLACAKAFDSDTFAQEKLGRSAKLGTLDMSRVNRNGGAIAIGHPVGCTGARIVLTAAHELQASDRELTLATLCIGGGQGGAVLLERAS